MIDVDDFVRFCRRTIDGTRSAVDRIGDSRINTQPDLTGGSTPFQLVTHAFSAAEWWCAHIVCGYPSDRVRSDEFAAHGSVADLHTHGDRLLARLVDLKPEMAAATELAFPARTQTPLEGEWTVGAALIHAYEELAQHLGHLEMTADVLVAET